MAAVTRVFTLRRAARMRERDEELFWDLADQLEPDDGFLWIYDVDNDDGMMAFVDFGLDNLKEVIADQVDRRG